MHDMICDFFNKKSFLIGRASLMSPILLFALSLDDTKTSGLKSICGCALWTLAKSVSVKQAHGKYKKNAKKDTFYIIALKDNFDPD